MTQSKSKTKRNKTKEKNQSKAMQNITNKNKNNFRRCRPNTIPSQFPVVANCFCTRRIARTTLILPGPAKESPKEWQ